MNQTGKHEFECDIYGALNNSIFELTIYMKVYAFIQMHNEASSGNLERCLNNCIRWADKIIIYDDKSTDDSVELAKNIQNILF